MINKLIKELEDESISIIRDSYSHSENPVSLYSIGKDSNVLLNLIKKSFYPAKIPFPLMHIDTKWKFKEMINFRNRIAKKFNINLIIYTNVKAKKLHPQLDKNYTHVAKTLALKTAIDLNNFDFIYAGARRDEESSRSKERVVSLRKNNHYWDPKNQRPEIWKLFNYKKEKSETFRIFPLSNWTELDIWEYIKIEKIEIPNLYYAKKREVINHRNKLIMIDDNRLIISKKEKPLFKKIRFRTLGCYPLTAAVESSADTIDKIIKEIKSVKMSERQGRLIDHDDVYSMEKKKIQGYF